MDLAIIPSPATAVWHLGPFPVRAYAVCIIAGIVAAALIMEMRLRARGAARGTSLDVAAWAVSTCSRPRARRARRTSPTRPKTDAARQVHQAAR